MWSLRVRVRARADACAQLLLGSDLDANTVTLHYIGVMDELHLYDRALADAEIAALASP